MLLFDRIPEGDGDLPAPAACSCVIVECIVDEVLSCEEELCEMEEGISCVVGSVDVDVDPAAFVDAGTCFLKFPDDGLEQRDIFICEDGGDQFDREEPASCRGSIRVGSADGSVVLAFPHAIVAVDDVVVIVVVFPAGIGGIEGFRDNSLSSLLCDSGHLDFDTKFLILDPFVLHFSLSFL